MRRVPTRLGRIDVGPPRRPPAPQTDEEWERRTLEGVEPDDAKVRHDIRRIAEKADTLVAMAESRERWSVFRTIAKRFALWVAAMVAGLSLFKEQLLALIGRGPSP